MISLFVILFNLDIYILGDEISLGVKDQEVQGIKEMAHIVVQAEVITEVILLPEAMVLLEVPHLTTIMEIIQNTGGGFMDHVVLHQWRY